MNRRLTIFTLILALATPLAASAQLDGRTIRGSYLYPTQSDVFDDFGTAVVGAGVEFSSFGQFALDFFGSTLRVTNTLGTTVNFIDYDMSDLSPATYNGWGFFDALSGIDAITGVSANAATTLAGFDASRLSFDENSFAVNLVGYQFGADDVLELDLQFASVSVPEPSTYLLMLAGLFGLGFVAWRRGEALA